MIDPDHAPASSPPDGAPPPATGADDLAGVKQQLAEAQASVAAMRETLLRGRAELDNQRKRLQRDVEQSVKFANEKLLRDLLPVYDGLESGLAMETGDVAAVREGLSLTLKALWKVGEANGLAPVDPVGQPLDPEQHHAVSLVDAPGSTPGTVVSVMQKGYLLNGRLLRPALVAVAKDG